MHRQHQSTRGSLRVGRRCAALVGVAATALTAPAAFAADAPPEDASSINEIIVTAQKREQSINSVPMSITAATGEDLDRLGVKEPRDLVKLVPGLTYADSFSGTPIFTLRGIGFNDNALAGRPTVTIYIDEAPIPFAIETRGTNLDLERVEVLKGPQGTLFGQNSTGGAINFIAAKPTDSPEAGLDLSYGRFNQVDASGFVSGPITPTLRARVAVEHQMRGDWQKSYTHGGTLGSKNFTNGRLLLEWEPSPDFKAQLNLNGWLDRSETQAAQLVAITPNVPPLAGLIPGLLTYPLAPSNARAADWNRAADYRRDDKFYQANLRLDFSLSDSLTLTSLTSYNQFKTDSLTDTDGMTLISGDNLSTGKIESVSQELRLAGDLPANGHFVIGVSASYDDAYQRDVFSITQSTVALSLTTFGVAPLGDIAPINDQRVHNQAVFANVDFNVTDTISVNAGARYTNNEIKFRGCTADIGDGLGEGSFGALLNLLRSFQGLPANAPILPGGCETANAQLVPGLFSDELNEDNVSWRAGAEWKPGARTLIYANVSKGYKAGSYPTVGTTVDTQYSPARQESVLAYEAGFKASLLSRTLQLNGAVFYYDYSDKQILGRVVDPIFGPIPVLVNAPKSDVRGAELQAIWSPMSGLTVNTGLSYINSRIRDAFTNFDPNGTLTNFDGQAFPNTPKWQFASDVNYTWNLTDSLNAFVGGNVTHQSRTNSQLGELPTLVTKAYTLVDLRAGIETPDGKWRASIWGRNVGNTYYWTAATKPTDTTVRFAGMPATYGITVSRRFN